MEISIERSPQYLSRIRFILFSKSPIANNLYLSYLNIDPIHLHTIFLDLALFKTLIAFDNLINYFIKLILNSIS